MDFCLTADQHTLQGLAKDTLARRTDHRRLSDIDLTGDHSDSQHLNAGLGSASCHLGQIGFHMAGDN